MAAVFDFRITLFRMAHAKALRGLLSSNYIYVSINSEY
jgi:hypothetical protein